MPSNNEYSPVSWTEIFCQCLPMRKTRSDAEVDIEMQINNPVVPSHIVRANNPDNIHRPSHNSWWLTADDSSSGPSAPPSRSGAQNPVASYLENNRADSEVFMSGGRPVSSVYSTDATAAGVSGRFAEIRVPRISPRAASYAAVLDVQAGIDARKSAVSPPDETPASPTGSVDSIDFFSGKAAQEGFGERGERCGGRVAPQRPKRYEGVSPYIA
ncbi:hypothetical protein E4T51_05460 [Aureobasidium sp. EXF-12344]|nr:hypothetical protein E4T51_05460 [Aureobasidium sp. EXF-12344]